MESYLQFLLTLFSILLAVLFSVKVFHLKRAKACHSVPEARGAWPIIGHVHLFGGQQLRHKILEAMADKDGPVFTIKLGSHRVLVVSSWEMARECFTIHDKAFSTKAIVSASKLLCYDNAMFGFAPYGTYWRDMRKIVAIELLSIRRFDMLKQIHASEVGTSIRELYNMFVSKCSEESGVLVEMKQWFKDLTHNIALRTVAGKRFFGASASCEEGAQRCQELIRDFFKLFGVFVLSDAIPWLGWLNYHGYEETMKKTAKELDILVGGWLEEHKQKRMLGGKGMKEQDFMDVMLNILEETEISGFDADTINKATCLNVILGVTDTTMVTLTWALSLLLNNPGALKKAQEELDIHVSKDRNVNVSDINNLTYLQAIVKETMRLCPPAPVLDRAAQEDCTLSNGYQVPAGTRLLVNIWKIQRDKRIWPNPEEFQPERFLSSHKDIDLRGKNFEFIPFGTGRRICPGISLGLQIVHFILASLLHSFEVAKPTSEDVDMTESKGLTNLKATPLDVLLTPRLDSSLYV